LSPGQQSNADEMVTIFNNLSQALDDFRTGPKVPPETTPEQLEEIRDKAQACEDLAHNFTADSIGATLQSIQPHLNAIKAVTKEAQTQLTHLNDVSKVISIAAAAVSVGTAIAAGNPGAILTAADDLKTALT
jgi:hypothetical protein